MIEILQWYNLVFLLPIFATILFVGGVAVGVADFDMDVDVEIDAADVEMGFIARALSVFGVGKVPISLFLIMFMPVFGLVGLVSNRLLEALPPGTSFPVSLLGAGLTGFFAARAGGAVFTRVFRKKSLPALGGRDLVGCQGFLVTNADTRFGKASIATPYNDLVNVLVRTADGTTMARGEPVVLVDYNRRRGFYLIEHEEWLGEKNLRLLNEQRSDSDG